MAEEAPVSRRMNAMYEAFFPWCVLIIVSYLVVQALGGSRQLQMTVFVPVSVLAAAGACYAGSRIAIYGWRFDRTPPAAPWTETVAGARLVQALRRVTLNGLSSVTPETRLRRDLELTSGDVASLFTVLELGRVDEGDPTIQTLLDAMNTLPAANVR